MTECAICGEQLTPGAKSCGTCGTAVLGTVDLQPSPSVSDSPPKTEEPLPHGSNASIEERSVVSSTSRECPECHARYGPGYADEFCRCGVALQTTPGAAGDAVVTPGAPDTAPAAGGPSSSVLAVKPPAGTICLVVYSADRQPVLYFPLDSDVTLIGRSDPVRGDFPDLDLGSVLDADAARRISRKHALVLRSRENGAFTLRPLAKNTGTQIERELTEDLKNYPLSDGTRIVLGGEVRLKFEMID